MTNPVTPERLASAVGAKDDGNFELSEWRLVSILDALRLYELVARTEAPLYKEAKAAFAELLTLRADIQHANEALAACQAQAAGRIRELEARLRATNDDSDTDDEERDDSPYCDCGSFPDEEELAFGRCKSCGKIIED